MSYAMTRACSRIGLTGDRAVTRTTFVERCRTWLGNRGERPDAIEAIAGHAPKGAPDSTTICPFYCRWLEMRFSGGRITWTP